MSTAGSDPSSRAVALTTTHDLATARPDKTKLPEVLQLILEARGDDEFAARRRLGKLQPSDEELLLRVMRDPLAGALTEPEKIWLQDRIFKLKRRAEELRRQASDAQRAPSAPAKEDMLARLRALEEEDEEEAAKDRRRELAGKKARTRPENIQLELKKFIKENAEKERQLEDSGKKAKALLREADGLDALALEVQEALVLQDSERVHASDAAKLLHAAELLSSGEPVENVEEKVAKKAAEDAARAAEERWKRVAQDTHGEAESWFKRIQEKQRKRLIVETCLSFLRFLRLKEEQLRKEALESKRGARYAKRSSDLKRLISLEPRIAELARALQDSEDSEGEAHELLLGALSAARKTQSSIASESGHPTDHHLRHVPKYLSKYIRTLEDALKSTTRLSADVATLLKSIQQQFDTLAHLRTKKPEDADADPEHERRVKVYLGNEEVEGRLPQNLRLLSELLKQEATADLVSRAPPDLWRFLESALRGTVSAEAPEVLRPFLQEAATYLSKSKPSEVVRSYRGDMRSWTDSDLKDFAQLIALLKDTTTPRVQALWKAPLEEGVRPAWNRRAPRPATADAEPRRRVLEPTDESFNERYDLMLNALQRAVQSRRASKETKTSYASSLLSRAQKLAGADRVTTAEIEESVRSSPERASDAATRLEVFLPCYVDDGGACKVVDPLNPYGFWRMSSWTQERCKPVLVPTKRGERLQPRCLDRRAAHTGTWSQTDLRKALDAVQAAVRRRPGVAKTFREFLLEHGTDAMAAAVAGDEALRAIADEDASAQAAGLQRLYAPTEPAGADLTQGLLARRRYNAEAALFFLFLIGLNGGEDLASPDEELLLGLGADVSSVRDAFQRAQEPRDFLRAAVDTAPLLLSYSDARRARLLLVPDGARYVRDLGVPELEAVLAAAPAPDTEAYLRRRRRRWTSWRDQLETFAREANLAECPPGERTTLAPPKSLRTPFFACRKASRE